MHLPRSNGAFSVFVCLLTVIVLSEHALSNEVPSSLLGNTLGDRLVMEINSTAYSQRQVEVYDIIRQTIDAEANEKVSAVDEERWPKVVEAFANAMLIEQEAQRLGSFRPTLRAIEAAREVYASRLNGSEAFQAHTRRLDIDERTLQQNMTTILRVEAFLRSKRRQQQLELSFTEDEWFIEIASRSHVRLFADALEFRAIKPVVQ